MSYKVAVKVQGEPGFSYNAQRFSTREEAEKAGSDLMSRWIAVERYEVQESPDPANYRFEGGQAKMLESEPPAAPIPAPAPAPEVTPEPEPETEEDPVIEDESEPILEKKPRKPKKTVAPRPKKKDRKFPDGSSMKGIYESWSPKNQY